MQAIVAHAAKDIRLESCEVNEPKANEVQINVLTGGICGSDLHYYQHGGFGTVRLQEPMILGHEVCGKIVKKGPDTDELEIGQLVAVSPSRPCKHCEFCLTARPNHCTNMRFYGSAMPFPHIQGAFREKLTVNKAQCAIADSLTTGEAAMAEPLAVTIHAAKQAGNLVGKRVLVTGCGPIGLLCILVALTAGAREVIATDIADYPLTMAKKLGATNAINVANVKDPLARWSKEKGIFDVLFECTGVAAALYQAIPCIQPRGTIVQLGLGGDMSLPMQQITAKELQIKGSFRFHEEFFTGVAWMSNGQIDVKPIITHSLSMQDAVSAFELASDRSQALKVQLRFN